jgi:Fe-S-cluster-containing dehydrogenase component
MITVRPKSDDELSRRDFLSLMAASMALAGIAGCKAAPPEKIVPYVQPPEAILPGTPLYFATAMPSFGYAIGLIVESHEGRPIKVEGNPDHPASLGATDVFAQASLLTLYDPERAQTVSQSGQIGTWDGFITDLRPKLDGFRSNGRGLRILTETVTSPTFADLMNRLLAAYPGSRWHQYEPVNRDNARAGARMIFGRYVDIQYQFEKADVIVSLDSDFLTTEPGRLRYAREFTRRRRIVPGGAMMNRLYVAESMPTVTGAMADHRYPMRSSDIRSFLSGSILDVLERNRGRSIVIAGESQPPEVHAFVHQMNQQLGNVGQTVFYSEPVEPSPLEHAQSLRELVEDMKTGAVDTLISIGGNPVYTAPADLEFSTHMAKVALRVQHSLYYDETAALSHWHVPESYYLESWGDARAYDGTISIIQPLINPLYQSKTSYELLSALLGDPSRSNYEIVQGFWKSQHPDTDFDDFWIESVRKGLIANSQASAASVQGTGQPNSQAVAGSREGQGMELNFRPDPSIWDGRWANNAWLQELPKPITKLVWDNAAFLSPATAANLGIRNDDVVEIRHNGRSVEAPAFVVPGHADQSITVHLGYGRTRSGNIAKQKGFNPYSVRTADSPWTASGLEVRKTGRRYSLVTTQQHFELEKRHHVRYATAGEFAKNPNFAREAVHEPAHEETLYPPYANIDYAWGMAIDLSTCIGCNACVIACQAENNVPVVGKDECANSREMHWLRIDTYIEGAADNPQVFFEPMLCQHCEHAPCELVCPVAATSHSSEGINEMTYNRCVGTRYCSNNCPYKVRRFNFYEYTKWDIPQFRLLYNPDVTVRSRGVMEKCTYCVQRVNRARITAKKEDRLIREGEVLTACQQACPTEAITFGNTADPDSAVSKQKAGPRNYAVLADLNTRPRTTYLAKLTNPNSE